MADESTGSTQQVVDQPLGDGGLRALEAERQLRRDAEAREKALKAQMDELNARDLKAENERLKKEAEDGRKAKEQATSMFRSANLTSAFAEQGITGAAALAAQKLVDGVEFDAENKPVNLADRIAAAKATFGEAPFTTPTPGATPGGTSKPDLHQGAGKSSSAKDEDAMADAYFKQNFPHAAGTAVASD